MVAYECGARRRRKVVGMRAIPLRFADRDGPGAPSTGTAQQHPIFLACDHPRAKELGALPKTTLKNQRSCAPPGWDCKRVLARGGKVVC